ncbi:MAG TPA: undecaprenyl-diphosphatase UppP [Patescibacteria group bacterium]|jgi:undecaprenyl-diphosphatase|nr:undecaprenyl-diphosphatase UppP [Patescibacteria group bacterium]
MEIFQAFILGMVQGLGEFLPISSSAHLIITPWLFNWTDPGLAFDVALHWGTLLAVLVYFWQDVWLIFKGFIHSLSSSKRDLQNNIYQKLAWLLILASVPGAIIGKLLETQAEHAFRSPLLIAGTLSVMGVVLFLADKFGEKVKNLNHISWVNALVLGLSQAVAIIPGVSRSGATITAGLFQGFKREDAARFSFLMSIPIIAGAGVLKLPDILHTSNHAPLVVGFISAAVFGFLSIKFLMKYISNRSYALFTWYRLALAALIVIVYMVRK